MLTHSYTVSAVYSHDDTQKVLCRNSRLLSDNNNNSLKHDCIPITTFATRRTFPVNMPDPIRIRSGSAWQHWPEAGRMILAHRLASGPDPLGQTLTQSARTKSDPGWFCTIIIRDVCGRTEPSLKVGNRSGPDDSHTPACRFRTGSVGPNPSRISQN